MSVFSLFSASANASALCVDQYLHKRERRACERFVPYQRSGPTVLSHSNTLKEVTAKLRVLSQRSSKRCDHIIVTTQQCRFSLTQPQIIMDKIGEDCDALEIEVKCLCTCKRHLIALLLALRVEHVAKSEVGPLDNSNVSKCLWVFRIDGRVCNACCRVPHHHLGAVTGKKGNVLHRDPKPHCRQLRSLFLVKVSERSHLYG